MALAPKQASSSVATLEMKICCKHKWIRSYQTFKREDRIFYMERNLTEQGAHSKPFLLGNTRWHFGLILGRCMASSPWIERLSSSYHSQGFPASLGINQYQSIMGCTHVYHGKALWLLSRTLTMTDTKSLFLWSGRIARKFKRQIEFPLIRCGLKRGVKNAPFKCHGSPSSLFNES